VFQNVINGRIKNVYYGGDKAIQIFNYLFYVNAFGFKSTYHDHPCNMANNS